MKATLVLLIICQAVRQALSAVAFPIVSSTGKFVAMPALADRLKTEKCNDCPSWTAVFDHDPAISRVGKALYGAPSSSFEGVLCRADSEGDLAFYSTFEMFHSTSFCGAKAVDFLDTADVCSVLSSEMDVVDSSTLLPLQRILFNREKGRKERAAGNASTSHIARPIVFVVDSTELVREGRSVGPDLLLSKLSKLADDSCSELDIPSWKMHTSLHVVCVDCNSTESVLAASNALRQIKLKFVETSQQLQQQQQQQTGKRVSLQDLHKLLSSRWAGVARGYPVPVYTKPQKLALAVLEKEYSAALKEIEQFFAALHKRVSFGRTVSHYKERVLEMKEAVVKSYLSHTADSTVPEERFGRSSDLTDAIRQHAISLFREQVHILQQQTTRDVQRKLSRVLELSPVSDDFASSSGESIPSGEIQQHVRMKEAVEAALVDYSAELAQLEIAELGCKLSTSTNEEFQLRMQSQLQDFPESPMAKLAQLRKLEKVVRMAPKQSKKKKKGLGVSLGSIGCNVALSLVGMIRPPGFGNLQGYLGYATGLFGLPLEILLGIQNDGDSPEVMGEDREYPLLRLQPKIHFDVDL